MGKATFGQFADLTSAASTAAVDVSHLETIYICGGGTFVGTWELQFSMDGTNWHVHPTITGKTAAFNGTVGFRAKLVRITCTAYTSGTIKSQYSGDDEDRLG
jgi:hypothetical protein